MKNINIIRDDSYLTFHLENLILFYMGFLNSRNRISEFRPNLKAEDE